MASGRSWDRAGPGYDAVCRFASGRITLVLGEESSQAIKASAGRVTSGIFDESSGLLLYAAGLGRKVIMQANAGAPSGSSNVRSFIKQW
jgi:hypothetical protein